MHELALSRAILDSALRHAEGRPVRSVSLRVGALRQVVPATLAFHFELTARGTPCEGATLEQEVLPAVLRCEDCGRRSVLKEPNFSCPLCGCGRVDFVGGEEFEIESIEVEEEAPCTGSG